MFRVALFTTAKRGKQPEQPSADEWINIIWSIHTVEYYSALKRNEILTHATMWMNSENIMLSELGQTQKYRYCMIQLTRGT